MTRSLGNPQHGKEILAASARDLTRTYGYSDTREHALRGVELPRAPF